MLAILTIVGIGVLLGGIAGATLWWNRRADQKAYEALRQSQEDSVRIIRDRYLTPAEADKYNTIREQVEQEKPEINDRIRAQMEQNRFSL